MKTIGVAIAAGLFTFVGATILSSRSSAEPVGVDSVQDEGTYLKGKEVCVVLGVQEQVEHPLALVKGRVLSTGERGLVLSPSEYWNEGMEGELFLPWGAISRVEIERKSGGK